MNIRVVVALVELMDSISSAQSWLEGCENWTVTIDNKGGIVVESGDETANRMAWGPLVNAIEILPRLKKLVDEEINPYG
jgi:hypothetical protein